MRFLSSLSSLSLLLWGSVTVLVWGWGAGRQTVLVTYMRDELGSCAPGSFTAVVLFYIYGAAAGPAVARCESHDSSAGNRDGPVILAPHRLHVTAPVLIAVLFDDRRSPQHPAVVTCACTYKVVLFLLRTHASICFPGPSVSNTVASISNSINPLIFLLKILFLGGNYLASHCWRFKRTDCSPCLDFTFNIRLVR